MEREKKKLEGSEAEKCKERNLASFLWSAAERLVRGRMGSCMVYGPWRNPKDSTTTKVDGRTDEAGNKSICDEYFFIAVSFIIAFRRTLSKSQRQGQNI